jgi:hypothetical protein
MSITFRSRYIRPEYLVDENIGELSFPARFFYLGLLTLADRDGYVEWRPKRIKLFTVPYDDVDVVSLARELKSSGLVGFVEEGGKIWLHITDFLKHQTPYTKEDASDVDAGRARAIDFPASPVTDKVCNLASTLPQPCKTDFATLPQPCKTDFATLPQPCAKVTGPYLDLDSNLNFYSNPPGEKISPPYPPNLEPETEVKGKTKPNPDAPSRALERETGTGGAVDATSPEPSPEVTSSSSPPPEVTSPSPSAPASSAPPLTNGHAAAVAPPPVQNRPRPDMETDPPVPIATSDPPMSKKQKRKRERDDADDDDAESTPDPAFEAFWLAYPRKAGKQRARRTWRRLKEEGRALATQAVAPFAEMMERIGREVQYIPYPATWLPDAAEWLPPDGTEYQSAQRELEGRNKARDLRGFRGVNNRGRYQSKQMTLSEYCELVEQGIQVPKEMFFGGTGNYEYVDTAADVRWESGDAHDVVPY